MRLIAVDVLLGAGGVASGTAERCLKHGSSRDEGVLRRSGLGNG